MDLKIPEGKNAKLALYGAVAIAAVLLGAFALNLLLSGGENAGYLYVIEGEVKIKAGGEEKWFDAQDGMPLKEGDSVKTGSGRAKIILFETTIVRMEPFTEITLNETKEGKISIFERTGGIWSKVVAAAGAGEFEVETPSTVATVRGTGFLVKHGFEGTTVLVGEGEVEVGPRGAMQRLRLLKNQKAFAGAAAGKAEPRMQGLSEEEKAMVAREIEEDLKELKERRKKLIMSHPMFREAMRRENVSEGQVDAVLDRIDRGEIDFDVKERIDERLFAKIKALNEAIKRDQEALKQINREILEAGVGSSSTEEGQSGIEAGESGGAENGEKIGPKPTLKPLAPEENAVATATESPSATPNPGDKRDSGSEGGSVAPGGSGISGGGTSAN